jgi:hypothetical protein
VGHTTRSAMVRLELDCKRHLSDTLRPTDCCHVARLTCGRCDGVGEAAGPRGSRVLDLSIAAHLSWNDRRTECRLGKPVPCGCRSGSVVGLRGLVPQLEGYSRSPAGPGLTSPLS